MDAGVRRSILLALLIALGAGVRPANAQSDAIVQGQVVAAADGSALPGVIVTLETAGDGESRNATTDSDGRFAFAQVAPHHYLVSASVDGFEPRRLRVIVEPREVRSLSLALELARLQVDVTVVAEPARAPGTHSPSSTLLTSERINAIPVFERAGLPDAIVTAAPGMIRGHDDFVHIRGHEIALNPVIGGVAFWENVHAAFSAGVSPDIIDTANVMTGGFPAEYGNRFGGVVDVVTKSGLRMRDRGSVTLSIGGEGRQHAAGEIGGRRSGLGYYAFGSWLESDRFLSPPDPLAVHDEGRAGHAFVRVDRSGSRLGALNAVFMADGIDTDIPKTPGDAELRPQATAEQHTRQQTLTLGWTRAWSSAVVDAAAYQRWSELRLLPAAGPLTARASLRRELLTAGAKADVTRLARRQTFKAGVDVVGLRPEEDLRYEYGGYRELTHLLGLPHIHVADPAIVFSGRDAGGQVSAFAQDNIQLGSRVTADLGVRVDRYALVVTDTHLSPRANLAFRIGGGAVLHTSYNHFFVPPAIEGVLSSSAGLTRFIREVGVALPPLMPTVEDQFELGASTPWGPTQLAVTGYYRATDNPVHTTVWPDSRIYSYASFDRASAYGLEARADLPGLARYGVAGYVNYALGRVYFHNPVTGGFVTEAEHLTETNRFLAPMDQTHTLTAGGSYRHARSGVWAGVTVDYGSGTPIGHGGAAHEHAAGDSDHADAMAPGEDAARVPGHVTADASLGVDLLHNVARRPRLTLRVDVANIANHSYVIARDSEFSPAQYSTARVFSLSARIRF